MKKFILCVESLFLVLQIGIFSIFTIFTVVDYCINAVPKAEDMDFVIVVSLFFFFATSIKSWIFSKILKLDLSYKGPDTFKFVNKVFISFWIIVFIITVIFSLLYKVYFYFVLASAVNCFSIVLEFSIIKYFKMKG